MSRNGAESKANTDDVYARKSPPIQSVSQEFKNKKELSSIEKNLKDPTSSGDIF